MSQVIYDSLDGTLVVQDTNVETIVTFSWLNPSTYDRIDRALRRFEVGKQFDFRYAKLWPVEGFDLRFGGRAAWFYSNSDFSASFVGRFLRKYMARMGILPRERVKNWQGWLRR